MFEPIAEGIARVGGGSWAGVAPVCSDETDCNIYAVRTGDTTILVDCGETTGMPIVKTNLEEFGADPKTVAHLLLTHSHFDHSCAASRWVTEYNPRIHQAAVAAEFYDRNDHRLVGYQINEPGYVFTPYGISHRISDGEIFSIGGVKITAYVLPGHTPDATLFSCTSKEFSIWFCGDITFGIGSSGKLGGIGWLNRLWLSDLDAYRSSLERMLELPLPDVMLPGHGLPVRGASEIRAAVAASLETVEAIIGSSLAGHFGV